MTPATVSINRAPVLTLWASIVAERLGHGRATALTLGKAVAGLNAQSKGRRLGIYDAAEPEPHAKAPRKTAKTVSLLGRLVPVVETDGGLRAAVKDQPENPASVERYLSQKFGAAMPAVDDAMRALAQSYPPKRLASIAFALYEQFRPDIPDGVRGWGAKGVLHLDRIRGATDKS